MLQEARANPKCPFDQMPPLGLSAALGTQRTLSPSCNIDIQALYKAPGLSSGKGSHGSTQGLSHAIAMALLLSGPGWSMQFLSFQA